MCSAHAHLRVAHIGQPHPVNGGHQHRLFARLMGPGTSNPPSLLLLAVIDRFFEECNAVPSAVRWREQRGHDQRAATGTYMRGVCGRTSSSSCQKVDLNLIATGRDRHAASGHFGQTAPLHVACHRVGGHLAGEHMRAYRSPSVVQHQPPPIWWVRDGRLAREDDAAWLPVGSPPLRKSLDGCLRELPVSEKLLRPSGLTVGASARQIDSQDSRSGVSRLAGQGRDPGPDPTPAPPQNHASRAGSTIHSLPAESPALLRGSASATGRSDLACRGVRRSPLHGDRGHAGVPDRN